MADKTLAELQLISSVTGSESIPGDNGIQTYRLTPSQLKSYILADGNVLYTMLKDDIFSSFSAVAPASDDYFPIVDTSDSNKTKKALISGIRNAPYRAVTTTDTATAADETLKLSGTSFTQTLPANGSAGKRLKLIHAGTSITNKYTLATQSGATIGGIASGSYLLCTNGEVLELEDDGTNWIIVNHYAKTPLTPISGAPVTVFADTGGGSPAKGVTSEDFALWARDGQFAYILQKIVHTANTGYNNGSGDYKLKNPAGLEADSAVCKFYTTVEGFNSPIANGGNVGTVYCANLGATQAHGAVVPYDKDYVRFVVIGSDGVGGFCGSAAYQFQSSPMYFVEYRIPVKDFQP